MNVWREGRGGEMKRMWREGLIEISVGEERKKAIVDKLRSEVRRKRRNSW